MDGFGSHTFPWVNARGERFFVKFHFKTDQGIRCLTEEESARIAGENPQHHQIDLLQHIERGEHPSWTFELQVMPEAEAACYRFNPFDLTKVSRARTSSPARSGTSAPPTRSTAPAWRRQSRRSAARLGALKNWEGACFRPSD